MPRDEAHVITGCSFCRRPTREVAHLVAAGSVAICDACARLAFEAMGEGSAVLPHADDVREFQRAISVDELARMQREAEFRGGPLAADLVRVIAKLRVLRRALREAEERTPR